MVNESPSEKKRSQSPLVGDHQLFRLGKGVVSPKKILLVGNGAVEGGWPPLARALGCDQIKSEDTLASLLAGFTFHYRNFRNELLISLHDPKEDPAKLVSKFKEELDILHNHRWQVANAYQTAESLGEIRLRSCEPIDTLFKDPREIGVITTNWDGLIWNQHRFQNVIQIHGLSTHSDSLIFPSELSTDEQIFELARFSNLTAAAKDSISKLGKHYRGLMASALRNAHGLAMQWLREAEEITVWGLALHPYDAELLTVVQNWARYKPKVTDGCVTIINPNDAHRDRVATVLAALQWTRRDYDPRKCEWVRGPT